MFYKGQTLLEVTNPRVQQLPVPFHRVKDVGYKLIPEERKWVSKKQHSRP